MRAAVIASPRRARVIDVAVPEPGPREVRIRMEGSGVCASNIPVWEGRQWFGYPLVAGAPGHEGWGWIDAVGEQVDRQMMGARVAALSYKAYAEHDLASADFVVPLPSTVGAGPFPGEPLGCAMNIFARSDIRRGQTVAVVGVGFLGALLVRLAANAGARVLAISRRPFALDVAEYFGAHERLLMDDGAAPIERVRSLTANDLCDRVIECVGLQLPLDLAGEITAEGGRLVIAGFHQDGARQVNLFLWNWRGIDVVNAHERNAATRTAGMKGAVEAVVARTLDPSPLYTHRYALDELDDAFHATVTRPDGFLKALVHA